MELTSLCIWAWFIAGGLVAPGTPDPAYPNVPIPVVHIQHPVSPRHR